MSVAFGSEFVPAAALVPPLALAMSLLGLASILVFFHIAEGTRAYRIILIGVVVEAGLIAAFHRTPLQIAWVVVGVSAVVTAVLYRGALDATRWRPRPPSLVDVRGSLGGLNGEATLDLTVVLPCHNAGSSLREVLGDLERELADVGSYEIIVVSDGSTDDSAAVAESYPSERVRVVRRTERVGKGGALRVGLLQARGRYVAFMDSDGDIHPGTIRPFVALMELYGPDIVLGSKRHPLSVVGYPPLRRLMSWTYHKLTRLLFRVNVRDTQTGAKLIRRDVLAAVLPRMLEKRYAFDLELLVVARCLGFNRVFEAPIRLDYRFASQVDLGAAWRILLDTTAIFYRRYVLATYEAEESVDLSQEEPADPYAESLLVRSALADPS